MNCINHPDRPATAFCRTCGSSLCAEDQREIYGVIYCQTCLARQMGQAPPPGAPVVGAPAGPATLPGAPNPTLALLLAFIPGVGAIYNGQYFKAFVQVVIFAALIAMSNSGMEIATVAGLGIAAFYIYMLIDSYRTARAMSLGLPVEDALGGAKMPVDAPIAAIILIALGVIFLLHSMGLYFHFYLSRFFWPAVLIGIGVYLIQRRTGGAQ